ncbi:MAG: pectate lyase [Bacteroidota bacterium]|nr:pectate lyase [Bacteroidota bacterium]
MKKVFPIPRRFLASLLAIGLCLFVFQKTVAAHTGNPVIVVDQSGKGDFTSIQDAINSLPPDKGVQRVIYIRKGIYHEKIFLEKNFVTLIGENKNNTILQISLARDIWRCEHKDDWGVATLNLRGSDLVLENLTITNAYGFDHINDKEGMHVDCPDDSLHPFKTVKRDGHQMALRSFETTRLIVRNCILRAYGGDTVSPWNTEDGMFYFKDCEMEGGVDFYCPRGWAYAENCVFKAHGKVAAIWHDGSAHQDSKTVLKNCVFTGENQFKLGRFHRDAQFYLVNCHFAWNMADTPIYLNPSQPQNLIRWGYRVYFVHAQKEGGNYTWMKDNLSTATGSPDADQINAKWTFAGKWDPEKIAEVDVTSLSASKGNHPVEKRGSWQAYPGDLLAENMLVYQRAVGGWPKAVNEIKVNYATMLSETEKKDIRNDSDHIDATIDNNATSREIRYLVKAYKKTGNPFYLAAAEKGIRYCLKAQYPSGGWPQYYPDSSLYRSQITYNDDAMVNVLNILQDIVERKNDFEVVDTSFILKSAEAVQRAIGCILRTQIRVNGELTAWCAQYNKKTFQPEMARKFELVSISGNESVGITRFLMRIKNPSDDIKKAVVAAINWFEKVKIRGFRYADVKAPELPKGMDRVLIPDTAGTVWARFYEIGTNRPFFSGRNSVKIYDVSEIEYERRTGYAWYGTWPEKLLNQDYPAWAKKYLP